MRMTVFAVSGSLRRSARPGQVAAIVVSLTMGVPCDATSAEALAQQERNPPPANLAGKMKQAVDTYIDCAIASATRQATGPTSAAAVADAAHRECIVEYGRVVEASRLFLASGVSQDAAAEARRSSDAINAGIRDDVRQGNIRLVLTVRERLGRTGPKNGFRDLVWGDRPTADMVPIPPSSKIGGPFAGFEAFLRRGSDAQVAGHETAFIAYLFFKGGLCRVVVGWEGSRDGLEQIATQLTVAWGSAGEASGDKRAWFSGDRETLAILHASEHDDADSSSWTRQLMISNRACVERAANAGNGL